MSAPPCILSERTVATSTAASGFSPPTRHLMSKNFSAPRSDPKPASVTTTSPSASAGARREDAVAAVRDVAERPGVHDRRAAFERLHEVGADRVLEQHRHRARRLEVARAHRRLARPCSTPTMIWPSRCSRSSRLVASATIAMISLAGMMTQRSSRTTPFAGAAEADDRVPQRAIVHVDRPRPGDPPRVDVERVALLQVVVEHRRQQRVRARDGVEVAGEVQVDVGHRDHLRVAAAGRAALHAEHRAEARLAHAEDRVDAEPPQRLRQADRDRALAFAGRRRIDRGDEHEAAARRPRRDLERQLRLVLAVESRCRRA